MNRPHSPGTKALTLALVILFAALFVVAPAHLSLPRVAAQNPPAGGKKKPPPGASGFEQFAGRDAADKLIKGAATRRTPPATIRPMPMPAPPPRWETVASEAERQRAAGNFEGAVASYKQAIELRGADSRDEGELQYALGKVYSEMERYEDAAAEFLNASKRRPSSDTALYATYELGNAYLDSGKYAEAVAAYEETLQILNGAWAKARPALSAQYLPYPHYSLGLAHLGLKQKEQAAADFGKAIQLKPDFAEAHFNLGLTLWQLGRESEAWERQKKLKEVNAELAARLAALLK